ncbi:hypothetical protein NIES21_59290 (plasmid) [Anabaenopsis circularis NIES-21]|uniref:Uncharacterized protein n=1 Tax=Anabaenopsis circularis NIES-21 TaxID=1085406 RepID=A0A1Z4GRD7_9CYAN|nr:hypothetical protein NIES21_59290 [Anabaenopsis circularis NIES-21]
MNLIEISDLESILDMLEEKVLQHSQRPLSEAERIVIRGAWNGKDYKEMASESGYNTFYLQQKVAPPLWIMLSEIIGDEVKVRKLSLKNNLISFINKDNISTLENLNLENDPLFEQTKFYGALPKRKCFYGREKEIQYVSKRVKSSKEQCVALVGVGGIGKSLLAAKLIEELVSKHSKYYNLVIWKKVKCNLSVNDLVSELISIFDVDSTKKSFRFKTSDLLIRLKSHPCLIILDGLEALVQANDFKQKIEYGNFLTQLTEEEHQSCIILTSQLPIEEIIYTDTTLLYTNLQIKGLEENAALQIFHEKKIYGEECKKLIKTYRGNPSELESVAERINRYFGGNIQKFFDYKTTFIGQQLQAMLNQQFRQSGLLSDLQRQIMIYLADEVSDEFKLIPFSKIVENLRKRMTSDLSISELITAMEVLEQRSLIESTKKIGKDEVQYGLEPVVRKYILVDPFGFVHNKNYTEDTEHILNECA